MPRFPVPRQHQSSQWVYCYCYPLRLFCSRISVPFWKRPSSVLLFVVPFTSQLAIDISCRIYNRTLCRCSVLHTPAIYRFALRGETSISVRRTILSSPFCLPIMWLLHDCSTCYQCYILLCMSRLYAARHDCKRCVMSSEGCVTRRHNTVGLRARDRLLH